MASPLLLDALAFLSANRWTIAHGAYVALICAGLLLQLFLFYVAIMGLKRVRDAGKLTATMKVFGYPLLFMGFLLDFVVNVVIATVIFLELPREGTLSARLTRHILDGYGWRSKLALWVCEQLLDAFDPAGQHRV